MHARQRSQPQCECARLGDGAVDEQSGAYRLSERIVHLFMNARRAVSLAACRGNALIGE
jgi:hypothetical protein